MQALSATGQEQHMCVSVSHLILEIGSCFSFDLLFGFLPLYLSIPHLLLFFICIFGSFSLLFFCIFSSSFFFDLLLVYFLLSVSNKGNLQQVFLFIHIPFMPRIKILYFLL